jgi:predicted permease
MEIFMILQFLHVVWPIFAIAGPGWLGRRLGRSFDEKSISAIVTYLGVPSLLLSSLSRTSVQLVVLLQTLLAGGSGLDRQPDAAAWLGTGRD